MEVPSITVEALIASYEVFFLDAYGVLVESGGALPGAEQFLAVLRASGKSWVLLSNDASRLPSTTARRYGGFGISIDERDIITSGSLLEAYFADEGLRDAACIVLGTEDSRRYVEHAGGRIVGFDDDAVEVVVAADDAGYPFLEGIEQVVTTLFHRLDRGQSVRLVLPNPDRIYPKGKRAYGLTAGSVATVIEGALQVRYAGSAPAFIGLGKPHAPLYEAAMAHTGARQREDVVMLGDQLLTDILGANRFGIDSALLTTGLTQVNAEAMSSRDPRPTYVLDGLVARNTNR